MRWFDSRRHRALLSWKPQGSGSFVVEFAHGLRGNLRDDEQAVTAGSRLRKAAMSIAVLMLLLGGFGSIATGALDATAIMALSLASSLILLDLAGRPEPRSIRAVVGFALLATAVGAALVMVYERLFR